MSLRVKLIHFDTYYKSETLAFTDQKAVFPTESPLKGCGAFLRGLKCSF
jgi:hypothetical protein